MDELTLLRKIEAETPPLGPYARHVARARLQSEIEGARAPQQPRPPVGRLLLACVAVAAAGAIAIVTAAGSGSGAPEPRIQLTSAATTLLLASRETADDRVVVPREGQYYYLKEVLVETPIGGGERETFVDESWLAVGGNYRSLTSERGRAWMATDNWQPRTYEELEKLPTDPADLLLCVRSWPSDCRGDDEPMSPDDYETAYMFLTQLLRGAPVMPSALRSATYGALARIPGVEITEDRLSQDGPHALAIRRRGRLWPQALVISRGSYTYLGLRDINVREDGVKVRQVRRLVDSGLVDRIRQRPAP